jgi:thiamine biosynthesis protein ThiS
MAETAQKDRITVQVNGEQRSISGASSIADMLRELGLDPRRVAVERNLEIVPRSTLDEVQVATATSSKSCISSGAAG